MIQFIKGSWQYGEMKSYKRLEPEFEMVIAGKGFVGIVDDGKPIDEHKVAAMNALEISRKKIQSNRYDIVILDEINYAIKLNLIDKNEVIELIKDRTGTTLVLTGNYAAKEIIDLADLVTEMKEIKHPYKRGITAMKGIDY